MALVREPPLLSVLFIISTVYPSRYRKARKPSSINVPISFYDLTYRMCRESIVIVKTNQSAEISVSRSPELKKFLNMSVFIYTLFSLCEPRASTKSTGPISYDFSQNLYFMPKWRRKQWFWTFSNQPLLWPKLSTFFKTCSVHYLKPGLWATFEGIVLKLASASRL